MSSYDNSSTPQGAVANRSVVQISWSVSSILEIERGEKESIGRARRKISCCKRFVEEAVRLLTGGQKEQRWLTEWTHSIEDFGAATFTHDPAGGMRALVCGYRGPRCHKWRSPAPDSLD